METPRLVVGAASRAPPPAPRSQRRRILRPCGGAHCSPSARAAPPVLLTRCSSYSSSRCVQIPHPAGQHHSVRSCSHNCCARVCNCSTVLCMRACSSADFGPPIRVSGTGTAILMVRPAARAPVPSGGFPVHLDFISARIGLNQRMMFVYVGVLGIL